MYKVVSVFIIFLLLIGILIVNASIIEQYQTEEISYKLPDGLEIFGWVSSDSKNLKAPLYVLLPMMGHTHESYDPFVNALYKRNKLENKPVPYILSLDLRGHGKSTKAGDKTFSFKNMSEDDFVLIPDDIKEVVTNFLSDTTYNIDQANIIIIDASIGANSSVMAGAIIPGTKKVVMLSPGENYRGLIPQKSLAEFTGKVLIFSAEDDSYSAESSRKLSSLDKKRIGLEIFDGKDHGTTIINNSTDAMKILLDWLYLNQ